MVQRLVSIACLAIIARLISKDSYGVFRELLSLHLICFVLLPIGFDQLYVRDVADRLHYAKMLRIIVIISAFAVAILVIVLKPWIAAKLNLQEHSYLLYVFWLPLLFQAAKLPRKIMLAAKLDFRNIGIGEFLNTFATMAGGALLLFWWRTPAALYVAYTMGEVLEFAFLRTRPMGLTVDIGAGLASMQQVGPKQWRFALFSSSDQVLNAMSANAPVLLLGGALSHESAAKFSMASSLITMPLFLLVGALSRVTLPSLAGRNERELQARILDVLGGAAAYIVPVLIGVAIFAQPLVHIVLGRSWVEETAPFVQWLAIYCIFVGLFSGISSLDVIRDRMDIGLGWNVTTFVLRATALVWGQRYGVIPAVAAYSIVSAIMWLANGFILGWLLRCGTWKFHSTWLKFVPLWLALAIACWITNRLLLQWPFIAVVTALLPALLYIGAVHLFYPSTAQLFQRLLTSPRVQNAFAFLRRGESADLASGGTGTGIP